MRKYSVIIKRPGEIPRHVNMSLRLENLQTYVGGYIEVLKITSDFAIICNEEGRFQNLPYNCTICNIDFVGNIIFVGVDGDEFTDIPLPGGFKGFKRMFAGLWEVES